MKQFPTLDILPEIGTVVPVALNIDEDDEYASIDGNIYLGNCLDVLKEFESGTIDSIVTDPPYGLRFMARKWDYKIPSVEIWEECLRVLKPGGYLLAFSGTRTNHRLVVNVEDAGFEIRDMIAWVYGSGFPKSMNIGKAIDKAAGLERDVTAPASLKAQQWEGWGTALKPAFEPITVARKPFKGTVANNVLEHGTGGLNIDGCRVQTGDNLNGGAYAKEGSERHDGSKNWRYKRDGKAGEYQQPEGRFPANLCHDGSEEVLERFLITKSGKNNNRRKAHTTNSMTGTLNILDREETSYVAEGSAARFFYCAKTSKKDRGEGNNHPTVKPTDLMRYLIRLVTPPNGVVLDPFMGSGSTGKAACLEGFAFVGVEMDEDYYKIAKRRIGK
jgi:DNA modification methylase